MEVVQHINTNLLLMSMRLLIALVLGGVIGYEREVHGRPAGLRTHILVCLGAALFTIISDSYTGLPSADPTRIAAQIVSGIGFLGAGTIIRQGSIIRGLTTAASLWTVAAIGMAVGSAPWINTFLAIIATAIVVTTLSIINKIEWSMISRQTTHELLLIFHDQAALPGALEILARNGFSIRSVVNEEESGLTTSRLKLLSPIDADLTFISSEISKVSSIVSFSWDSYAEMPRSPIQKGKII